jgi:hypothetical protein
MSKLNKKLLCLARQESDLLPEISTCKDWSSLTGLVTIGPSGRDILRRLI